MAQRMLQWISWTLLAIGLLLQETTALRVTRHDITTLAGSDHKDTEHLLQEWTVATDADSNLQQVQSIVTDVGCQVYVTYAPATTSSALATVRVTGDNDAVIQRMVEVSSTSHELIVQTPKTTDTFQVQGYVRAEVIVHTAELVDAIQAAGSGDVVVDDRVFAATTSTGNLTLHSSGSGDLFLPPQLLVNVNGLEFIASGSGSMHFVASEVTVNSINARISGSGDLKLGGITLRATRSMSVMSSGSGSINSFFSRLQTPTLLVKTSGPGDVKLYKDMTSSEGEDKDDSTACEFTASGSGKIQANSLVCTSAHATIASSGEIVMTVRQSLACKVTGSGKVTAATLSPSADVSGKCKVRSSHQTAVPNTPSWVGTYTLPARDASLERIVHSGESWQRDDHDTAEHETTTMPQARNHQFPWQAGVFVVVIIVGAILCRRATFALDHRRELHEQSPLVKKEDKPVYV